MNTIFKHLSKNFWKWLVQWLWIIVIVWLTYATSTINTVSPWQQLTSSMWNTMVWNYNYSTNEVLTGKKWIDWKPIYRTVVDLWNLSSNANNSNNHFNINFNTDKNIETSVSSSLILNNTINYLANYRINDSSQFRIRYWADYFGWVASTNWATFLSDVKIVVEYTKTTD